MRGKVMKENLEFQLKARFTAEQKQQILDYCEKYDMTVSEFIRYACERMFQKEVE